MSKYIPILFSTAMVQAILEGRKTQTRRVVKPQPPDHFNAKHCSDFHFFKGLESKQLWEFYDTEKDDDSAGVYPYDGKGFKCPYGQPGDVLYVREKFAPPSGNQKDDAYMYAADYPLTAVKHAKGLWKPSIHMPKQACRIFLKIVSIRVEPLQNISEDDAMSEGIQFNKDAPASITNVGSFAKLWQTIHAGKPSSWENNPWVWVVEFERCEKPENFA